ncbi:MAG: hypothetical protein KGO98_05365 [Rickettsiales bacterium]|nr:hypothetical protein [Rickettsiales bacterium]
MKGNDYQEKSASVILPKPSKIIIIEEMKKVINRRKNDTGSHCEVIFAFGKKLSKTICRNFD